MISPTERPQSDWHAAYRFLQTGKYEQAAEILRSTQTSSAQAGNTFVATSAGAARQICMALMAYKAEIEWHQLAQGNAELREQTLNQHVQTILSLISSIGQHDQRLPTTAHPYEPSGKGPVASRPSEKPSIFQRIANFLGFESDVANHFIPSDELHIPGPQPDELTTPHEVDKEISHLEQEEIESGEESSVFEVESSAEASTVAAIAPQIESRSPLIVSDKLDEQQEPAALTIYCLGPFRVYQNGELLDEWNGQKGVSILKYLMAHHESAISKDVLMDVFWPDADPEAARRNLHQAIYSLRQTLRRRDPDIQHVRFENNQYLLNPELRIWTDVVEFEERIYQARRLEATNHLEEAMAEYSVADSLFQGDFLTEDIYDEWTHARRERLRMTYLEMAANLGEYYFRQDEHAAAIALCQKVVSLDNCDETAHRRLMRCYLAQGQRNLAIRQYHRCVRILRDELDVPPSDETTTLYEQIASSIEGK